MLELKNVSKYFCHDNTKMDVISNISFSVNKGEILVIVGPSGSGKSTLLNLISNLVPLNKGEIEVNGTVGYMFQRDCLLEWKTVYQNILLPLELNIKKISKEEYEYRINEVNRLLKEYGLQDSINLYPNSLSGGMRQRVALIRTLVMNPDIILLDEAFSALDYQTKLKVSVDIYNIIRKENKTVIMVTHDISEAISMADKIIVLSEKPATIKDILKIELLENNPIAKRKEIKFQEYFNKIWNVISE